MAKYTLIRNPSSKTNGYSFGVVKNLNIRTEPHLTSTEADIYLFLGFHKYTKGYRKHTGYFGLKHIRAVHENEIRNRGFVDELNCRTLIPEYVASIVRPGTRLYYEGEIRKYPRLLAWTGTEVGVLQFREDQRHGEHWSIVTAYPKPKVEGKLVGKII